MKKNWFLRIAGLMLALAMITSCFVGSTFAKYVTSASGEDNARVAKWGVLIGIEGAAFGTQYAAEDEGYIDAGGTLSVKADETVDYDQDGELDQVVAPGTSSELLGQHMVATITGTPEVAARYIIEVSGIQDIVLPAATYTDYTHYVYQDEDLPDGYTDHFELPFDYSPIKWNLVVSKGNTSYNIADELLANLPANLAAQAEAYGFVPGTGCSIFDALKILDKVAHGGNNGEGYEEIIETTLSGIVSGGRNFQLECTSDGLTMSYDFDPNKVMDFTFELTWEWAFEATEDDVPQAFIDAYIEAHPNAIPDDAKEAYIHLIDQADTYLGNWELWGDAPYIYVSLTATAVQID